MAEPKLIQIPKIQMQKSYLGTHLKEKSGILVPNRPSISNDSFKKESSGMSDGAKLFKP